MTKPTFSPSTQFPPLSSSGSSAAKRQQARMIWLSLACFGLSCLIMGLAIVGTMSHYKPSSHGEQTTAPVEKKDKFIPQPAWAFEVTGEVTGFRGVRSLPVEAAQRHPLAPNLYQQAMDIGYDAYQRQDYQTALINFRRALSAKDGDRYATKAIANTEAIIQHQRRSLESEDSQR